MKSVSSGKTRGNHPHHRGKKKNKNKMKKKKKKKKYAKFLKLLEKQKKTVSEQSQNELESVISTPVSSPMSDE